MARLAFSKGIWSYVCKMDRALREYTPLTRRCSSSVATIHELIQKVPPVLESDVEITSQDASEIPAGGLFRHPAIKNILENEILRNRSKWIANGLLLVAGIACLSRSRSTLGTQIALGCILKKMLDHGSKAGKSDSVPVARSSKQRD
ncbi:hypothetical protein AXF42_Ash012428 [Apostasia shenzhenica]|uniref:Uncharacterized protein n=1 Tax=Apostasia shenzhenica TaxID=1088818 RepID=A0A2I0AQR5_9ASPA|nr:hypothetical protein AXF42_Ash012428 [Apostasia shenzhenica]